MILSLLFFCFTSFASENLPQHSIHPLHELHQPWSEQDLSPLISILGSSYYVGLGENVHATEGYNQAKFHIIKFLVEKMGFRAFAIEAPWYEAKLTADYVATCKGTAKEALKGIFGVWKSKSVADLLQWLCEYNQKNPTDPIKFFGFDTQNAPSDIIKDLKSRLQLASPAQELQMTSSLKTCFGYGLNNADYYKLVKVLAEKKYKIPETDHEACLASLNYIEQMFLNIPHKDENTEWVLIDVVGLRSNQKQFFHIGDEGKSSSVRDEGMAWSLDAIRERTAPNAKTIIWAHNWHLSKNNLKNPPLMPGQSMGYFIDQKHGAGYAAIALTGYKVEYQWPGYQEIDKMPTPEPFSVESLLHTSGVKNALIDFTDEGFKPNTYYTLGYENIIPIEQYRAAIYLDHCPPMIAP